MEPYPSKKNLYEEIIANKIMAASFQQNYYAKNRLLGCLLIVMMRLYNLTNPAVIILAESFTKYLK